MNTSSFAIMVLGQEECKAEHRHRASVMKSLVEESNTK
jgi:hypothetical protein